MSSRRIVSLLPAATELVCALGLEKQLVGRSHECDYPASVKRLPVLTQARIDSTSDSASIDRQAQTLLSQALSLYEVNAPLLQELKPDYVLTQTQCDVCAVSPEDVKKALGTYVDSRPTLLSLEAVTLPAIFNDMQKVADAFGVGDRGKRLVEGIKNRITQISDRARNANHRPRVLCIEWLDPLMASGNWVPTLVEQAGAIPLLAKAGKDSPAITWNQVIEQQPDKIIVMACGFDIERTARELALLTEMPEMRTLKAYKSKQVYIADGNQYFNRPGPRLLDSLEILAEIVHPSLFGSKRLGKGWVPYT